MTGRIEAKLKQHGIALPPAPAPAGNYVPFVISGKLVFVAGQLPIEDGKVFRPGRLGADVSLEDGKKAARLCGINLLAQLKSACGGDLDRVTRCVRLGGFVACTPEFTDQPAVVNGASDLMADVFGEAGCHARAAVGAPSLPRGAAVEIEAVFEIA